MTGPDRAPLGYLVPQFPGQTHAFFWREIKALEASGQPVRIYSTRPAPPGLVSHDWSDAALARTTFLMRRDPVSALRGALGLRPSDVTEPGLARDLILAAPAAAALARDARANGVRHVHVHSCGRAALVALLARRLGGPAYSLTLHGPLEDYGPGQRLKWRESAFALVITERLMAEVRRDLAGDLPPRLAVQPMGVDTDHFRRDTPWTPPDGPPDGSNDGTLRLIACGRLNPVKGHQELMEAVRLLLDRGRDVRLTILGEDDDGGSGFRRMLEARRDELELADRVTLAGAVDEDRVRAELLAAHIFVLASHGEPLGVAYMEAMACGLPVIGTDAGGVRELITDGVDGRLVPPRDPGTLADAIAALADDPATARRMAEAGRARVVRDFGAARGARTLIAEVERAHSPAP